MAKGRTITKAQRELFFLIGAHSGTGAAIEYLDSARALSVVNRKLFEQGKLYGIESIDFRATPGTAYDTVEIECDTMGETWVVHNAWTKAKALHDNMQELVLEDNPSIEGKWSDFKIFMSSQMRTDSRIGGIGLMNPIGYLEGEWEYAQYVLPEHNVDPASGEVLPAQESNVHMLGADVLTTGPAPEFISAGLINAYANSRATVFADAPNVPAGMATSFFNLLTDSGSQEPELADIIAEENDNPPYDLLVYPGQDTNGELGSQVAFSTINAAVPIGHMSGFLAQCGLIQFTVKAYLAGVRVATPSVYVTVNYAAGHYKGVAAIDMGQ